VTDNQIPALPHQRTGLTIGELIDGAALSDPAKLALVGASERLTRGELRTRINRLAAGFLGLGIEKGAAVLLQLPNWCEFIYCYFALQKIGAVPVLLISGYGRIEVSHLCRLTEAAVWIVPQIYRNRDYTPCIKAVREANPGLRHVISARAEHPDENFSASLEEIVVGAVDAGVESQIAKRCPKPIDIAHILPSGGTTGLPKAIPRTHEDYLCNVTYLHRAGEMTAEDVCLIAVPVGHNLALLNVVGAALVGYRLVLLDSTRVDDICHALDAERVTYLPTVPSLLKRILEFDGIDNYDLRCLRKISAGGEPATPDLIARVRKRLHCACISEFGMSEGPLCRTRLDDNSERIRGSVGKPICPHDEFKILDDHGQALPAETDGELAARGPGIFAGYLKNPAENERAFTAEGFFRTGDLARMDHHGNVTITGRIKDMINRGGEKISPAQIEKLLLAHPQIADAAVIGMPDSALGEKVCAYIRVQTEAVLDYEDIKTFMVSSGASKLLIPERVEFVPTLPLTEAGKHDKKVLREDIQRKLAKLS
jgi:non-ribosomal peptide synthetase component E (peptide arylation enzyme)